MTKLNTMTERDESLISQLLAIWESSVRATHHFLAPADLAQLAPVVGEGLAKIETLVVYESVAGVPVAFMGVEGDKLEMLFVAPEARGGGVGKRLLTHAAEALGVRYVDVNEQNDQAVGFYRWFGFRTVGRSELDGQGRPYPILHMERAGIAIRPAQPGDASYVSCLHMRLYEKQYGFRGIFEYYVMQGMADFLRDPAGGRLWVALDGDAIVGAIAIVRADHETAQLRWFVIHEEYQGRGLGRRLMDMAMAFVAESGYR